MPRILGLQADESVTPKADPYENWGSFAAGLYKANPHLEKLVLSAAAFHAHKHEEVAGTALVTSWPCGDDWNMQRPNKNGIFPTEIRGSDQFSFATNKVSARLLITAPTATHSAIPLSHGLRLSCSCVQDGDPCKAATMGLDVLQALYLDEYGRVDNRPFLMQNLSPAAASILSCDACP